MSNPLVSVILTTYNRPLKFLRAAIDSILNQTYEHWELIIVDDGSTTALPQSLINEYTQKDCRLSFIRQQNTGVSGARRSGVTRARGTFLCFQDDDDISLPRRLQHGVAFMQNNADVGAFIPGIVEIDEHGKTLFQHPHHKISIRPDTPLSQCDWHGGMSQAFYRHRAFTETGGFRDFFASAEDADFYLRFSEKHAVAFANEPLYLHRAHPNNWGEHPLAALYAICAYVSAYCRRHNMPCPIEQEKTLPEILTLAPSMFDDFPANYKEKRFFRHLIKFYKNEAVQAFRADMWKECGRILTATDKFLLRCGRKPHLIRRDKIKLCLSVLSALIINRPHRKGRYLHLLE